MSTGTDPTTRAVMQAICAAVSGAPLPQAPLPDPRETFNAARKAYRIILCIVDQLRAAETMPQATETVGILLISLRITVNTAKLAAEGLRPMRKGWRKSVFRPRVWRVQRGVTHLRRTKLLIEALQGYLRPGPLAEPPTQADALDYMVMIGAELELAMQQLEPLEGLNFEPREAYELEAAATAAMA